ncbi:MAG TPA: hypothetical protein DEG17_10370 [Cyanobacteria bacterium UBA11149]|nr:hypothetical protein [Cyanobacteria bacterium UBA11366]HBK66861.1 hypothetical protein [Cyanobacteria bacterium UBA11166]HBW89253.1 hypothetical protein [Cyanobacteria bacterium UBA11149]HCA97828.1 hypothetical protein [Cyanobacteria bacterium UBA9226]
MSLHIAISTTYPQTDSPAPLPLAGCLGGWRGDLALVEILFEGSHAQIEQNTTSMGKQFNLDAGNYLAVDSQPNRHSGRYGKKTTVPI